MQSADQWRAERNRILADPKASQALRRFQKALFAGDNPRIEDYPPTIVPPGAGSQPVDGSNSAATADAMHAVQTPSPESARRLVLLEELLQIEIEHRAKQGEAVSLDDYLQRFPELSQDTDCLRRLRETARKHVAGSTSPNDADTLLTPLADALTLPPPDSGAAPKSSAKTVRPGQFGDYELLEEIARGGMGVVYKARQTKLNRLVALKMILAGQLAGPEHVARFYTEAEAVAKLDHPGIVPIFEVGEHEGQHFFSMGFVEGQSLAQRVARGPIHPRAAAVLVARVAEAVQYAHKKGVIHRDLKPGNILLDKKGQARITDFGLAKLVKGEADLTGTGQILGTPSYMPPEQAAGKLDEVGPRSDVYSLGAILYCLLTGRPPFQAATAMNTLLQVLEQEPVPLRQLNAQVPLDLETIALKCLEKNPSRRYASARELADELQRFLKGEPILARPVGRIGRFRRWCQREPAVATLVTAVALLLLGSSIGGFWLAHGERTARMLTERQLRIATAERLAAMSYSMRTESPEISLLLAVESGRMTRLDDEGLVPGSHQALLDALSHIGGTPLIGHHRMITSVAISPDGRWIVTGSWDNTARVWNLSSKNLALKPCVLSGHGEVIKSVAISADSRWVVTGSGDKTARVWDLTAENPAANPRVLAGHQSSISSVAISPDSRWVVTGSGGVAGTGSDHTARVWDLTAENPAANPRVLNGHQRGITAVAISPDGRWIVTGSGDKTARVWDLTAENPAANPRILAGHQSSISSVAISADSRWVVTGSYDGTARVWDLTAENPAADPRVLSGDQLQISSVAVSSDSHWVVTGSYDGTARVWDLSADNPGANPRVLTGHQNLIASVTISADSHWLVTGSYDLTARVWNLTADNPAGNSRVLSGHQGKITNVAISPDSRWVVTGSHDRTARVWDLTAENPAANPRVLSGHQSMIRSVAISPDGRWIATGSWDNTARIWELAAEGRAANPRVLSGHQLPIELVAISPDSRCLVTGSLDKTARVWDLTAENPAANPRVLSGHQDSITSLTISPDSRWIVTGSKDATAMAWDLAAENAAGNPRVLSGHQLYISCVAIRSDSRWIITGSYDKTARIWDLTAGNPAANPRVLSGHQLYISSVAISPDGHWVVTGSLDKTARVWDLTAENSAANPRVLSGHQDSITSLTISPDSRWIVTGSIDATARVWDLTAENPAASPRVLRGHQGKIDSMAISPDGRWIVTATEDKTIQVWRWQWDDLVSLAGKVGRNFNQEEWKLYFPNEPYRKTFPDLPIPGDS